jgi:hypothetical protein
VFGVEPSYLVDRIDDSVLDREIVEALRDDTTRGRAHACGIGNENSSWA